MRSPRRYSKLIFVSSVVERAWLQAQSDAKTPMANVVYDSDVLTHVDIDDFVQSQQYTPVHKIVLGLSKLQLRQYLETSTDGIDTPDAPGYTPLLWACLKRDTRTVRTLLTYGADPNAVGRILQTPLHVARTPEIVRCLLEYNANVDAQDTSGRTPLHSFSYRQISTGPSVIAEILARGASINSKTLAGHTALHYAAAFGNNQLIPVLFERGISINETKVTGDTSLALAVRHNQVNTMKLLMEKSADISVRNEQGQSILHIAACFGRVETLEYLATCYLGGLSLSKRDKRGLNTLRAERIDHRSWKSPSRIWLLVSRSVSIIKMGLLRLTKGTRSMLKTRCELCQVPSKTVGHQG